MKSSYLFWTTLLLFLPCLLRAQATVKGSIRDTNEKAVSHANIVVQETSAGTTALEDGSFSIPDLPPGTYTLLISSVGYETRRHKIQIVAGENPGLEIRLREKSEQLNEVTVTATRTERSLDNVPMPVDIISGETIKNMGAFRLNEVLQEQTGLQVISDHGTGLQMQGLSSDYILVLVDGEPIIGRTAGTLDLTRLAVDNIARIEIIRGPSSSLYGSEAMAGVVNIITEKGQAGTSASVRTRFRSFNTWDASAQISQSGERLSASLFANRLSTDGYDLNPENISMTAPPFEAYTVSPKVTYRFSDQLKLEINGRFFTERQSNQSDITSEEGEIFRLDESARQQDWNIMPTLHFLVNDKNKLLLKNYTTTYQTDSRIVYQEDGEVYDESYFNQLFNRSEIQYDHYFNEQNIFTMGAGHILESVEATRYDELNAFRANYAFAQHQWMPNKRFNLVAGGRFDTHSQYASRFSPKLAAGYTVNEWLKVKASVGGGYKAPDFRQLLLSFTNPTAGYSVFGTSVVAEKVAELQAQGQIETLYMDPATIGDIKAESSLAFNAGFSLMPHQDLSIETNLFRNQIQDLIETTTVARKTNGQSVFSYRNFAEVVTQGVETQLTYNFLPELTLNLGYQYLDTRDVEAWDQLKGGKIYRKDAETNQTVKVKQADYGGLFNRSRHSGNAKLFYQNQRYDFNVSLRGIYRGRWGVGDINSNQILDIEEEYAEGYLLWNTAANKTINGWLTLEAGVNNLLNTTNTYESSLGGRIWYGGVHIELTEFFHNQSN